MPGLKDGAVVICDGYALDAAVDLRARYGEHRHFAVQTALMRALGPRPRRAYLFSAPGSRAPLYAEQCAALGVVAVGEGRDREELCAEIALDVWRAVG